MRKFGKHGICIEFPKDIQQIDVCCDYVNKVKISEIVLETDAHKYSLDFLHKIEFPERVKELSVYGNFDDIEALYIFTELRKLNISCRSYREIDLSNYRSLTQLSVGNVKSSTFKNLGVPPIETLVLIDSVFDADIISQIRQLRVLSAHNVKKINLEKLACNSNLEKVGFTQCDIRDLNGIEMLTELRSVSLSYCRSLESIVGLSKVPLLFQVEIVSCNKLNDLSELSKIHTLKTLLLENMKNCEFDFLQNLKSSDRIQCIMLEKCGSIPSIKFLDNFNSLQAFCGFGTCIKDGNLTPLLRLESARVSDKRHYNVKDRDLPFGNAFMHWWAE